MGSGCVRSRNIVTWHQHSTGGARFESRSYHQLSWLWVFVVFLSLSRQIQGQSRFLGNPFQSIIHPSSRNSTLCSIDAYSGWDICRRTRNMRGQNVQVEKNNEHRDILLSRQGRCRELCCDSGSWFCWVLSKTTHISPLLRRPPNLMWHSRLPPLGAIARFKILPPNTVEMFTIVTGRGGP